MTPLNRLLSLVAMTLMAMPGIAAEHPASEARKLWHQGILSGYQTLASEAGELLVSAKGYCDLPNKKTRELVQQNWQDAFLAWQQVRFVDFGPVETDNRAWQFQFWPDPKNLIARKAQGFLGGEQPVTAELIDRSGVAVQGFPMVEYLLFDEKLAASDHALPAARTCDLLQTVAGHIRDNGEQMARQWQSFEPQYLSNEQYTRTTLRAGMSALDILEERRLAEPMGLRGSGRRSIYAGDAWRSGTSLLAAEATVQGLKKHYLPGLTVLLEADGYTPLARRIQAQFNEVLTHFPTLGVPLAPLLAEDARFRELQGLYVDVSQLSTLVNDQASAALGVARGFNSSDGD